MIKTDAQRARTVVQIRGFRRALGGADRDGSPRSAAVTGSYEGVIRQREEELQEYDQLKSGELELRPLERLDQIASLVVKVRIAKGLSRNELARRLGVSPHVISRYEDTDYQTVPIGRLQEILDAVGVRTMVTLYAFR